MQDWRTAMQLAPAAGVAGSPARPPLADADTAPALEAQLAQYKVIRRNGSVVGFEPQKISIAMTKAFLAVSGGQGAASARVRVSVASLTDVVIGALVKRKPEG